MNHIISVIIPVYNGELKIRETIESILKQTFKNLEIIVINDGFTDSTLEIVQSIYDSRLQIFSYFNAGLSTSRNRGVSHSKGQFISFIDADDLWTVDKLEAQYKALQDNKKAAVAYSWTDYIDAEGEFLKAGRHMTVTGSVYSKLLQWNFLENGSNPLILKEALNEVGGFDESLAAAEDWDMWLRLSARYEFVCVDRAQILYRISTNSMSTNLKRQEAASLKVIERAFSQPQAKSLQHLKKYSKAELYKYLMFRAIEAPTDIQKSFTSALFWCKCVKHDPSVLKQRRVMLIAVLKIIFPQLYQHLKKLLHTKQRTRNNSVN